MNDPEQRYSIGSLYPAMHKFYSALRSLEQFKKGNNFFDNIACLDNFFSEYRNVTFVLQKSIGQNLSYKNSYKRNLDKYITNDECRWFVSKRNETTKEHPFNLVKKIAVTIYASQASIKLKEKIFTIENDIEYSTLIESLKALLTRISAVEVYFSVEFTFYEKGEGKEIYFDLISGILNMQQFLGAMKEDLNEDCILCDKLQQEINKMTFFKVPKDILFVDDYVYECKQNIFERGSRAYLLPGGESKGIRMPLTSFTEKLSGSSVEEINPFRSFILLHLICLSEQKTIMPTFMIIYEDDMFEFITFQASLKTTVYRKINEIATKIKSDDIKTIYYVTEMLYYTDNINEIMLLEYSQRNKHSVKNQLCFFRIDKNGEKESYQFDSEKVGDMKYVASILMQSVKDDVCFNFLSPIKTEFEKLKFH